MPSVTVSCLQDTSHTIRTHLRTTSPQEAVAVGTKNSCSGPERVWRCTVCRKVKELKGPHLKGKASVRSDCWPCAKKTTFAAEGSGDDTLLGAERRDSCVAKGGDEEVTDAGELSVTVFKAPIVPSEADELSCMLPVVSTDGAAEPAAASVSAVVRSADALWRCAVCHKVKDLKGPHLHGKSSVRSDCWPCAKKTTFHRDTSPVSQSATSPEPFKSAFGGAPASEASKPAATPFKSAFGGVPASEAAKPAATPFKSAFGGVPASEAAKPAATPFKSAFGGVPASEAAKPAATPFKSAFGGVPASEAAKPAATPFKSAFGGVPASEAAKPATTPFKSAFGGVPASEAAKPAATPFKSAFGGAPASEASKPAATPFKSAFSDVSGVGTSKSVECSLVTQSWDAAASFTAGGITTSSHTEIRGSFLVCQTSNAPATASLSPKADVAVGTKNSCSGPERVWRCTVCRKVKELKGPHLKGKASVRSDCWPCAKKTTFAAEGSGDDTLLGAERRDSCVAKGGDEEVTDAGELSVTVFKAPIVPSEADELSCMLPVVSTDGAAEPAAASVSAVVRSADALWRCAVCHKVKDLKGPHLHGKSSVRSDCWPCAKKTTFHRDTSPVSQSATSPEPFKSAFGGAPASEASKPAATPFKSAFGGVPASEAAKPAATPFKSAFGGVPASEAAKPAATPFKSAFGGVPASEAAKPAATPFKSAFGGVPASEAAKPAATPFKSAFGGVPASEAAKPAATPFKSAFGGAPASEASKPAATPFKSAFSDVSGVGTSKSVECSLVTQSWDAAASFTAGGITTSSHTEIRGSFLVCQTSNAPATASLSPKADVAVGTKNSCSGPERVWRCTVCRKVKELKGPHLKGKASVRSDCWPCAKKTTFAAEGSGDDTLLGAERRDSCVAKGGDEEVTDAGELSVTVFKAPIVPSEADELSCMLPVVSTDGAAEPAAASVSAVVRSADALWRCAVCHKVKDLKGPHLHGKSSVRSDCWPCAKKTTFHRDTSPVSQSATSPEPFKSAFGGVPASEAAKPAATPFKSAFGGVPASEAAKPAATPFKSAFGGVPASEAAKPAATPFKSAFGGVPASEAAKPATTPFKSAFGGAPASEASKPATTPFKSAFGGVPASEAAKPAATPFKSAFGGVPASQAAKPAATPFKSAFGGVPASEAAKPATTPFKSAFGDVPASEAAKPATTPFKSAFGGVPASEAAKPAATPFKSAFGGVPASQAAKPAATPFKSAFGSAPASEAAKPAATPFKSAFGGVPASEAAKPAATPFKSAFGDVPASEAAKPAATPFKSAFGDVPASEAAKPAATPFKSAFGGVPASEAAKPAATPFKSAFGDVPASEAAKPAATPFKSAFGDVPASEAAKPAATPFKSAFGGVPASEAAKPAATPFKSAFGDVPASEAGKPAATPFKSAFGDVPASEAAKPAATPFKSAFGDVPASEAAKPAATPFKSAFGGVPASEAAKPATTPFKSAFGDVPASEAAKPATTPFKSAFGGVPASEAAKPAATPFKSAFGGVPASQAAKPAATPFKSAFGSAPASEAAKPAATPFKSAFGGVPASEAASGADVPCEKSVHGREGGSWSLNVGGEKERLQIFDFSEDRKDMALPVVVASRVENCNGECDGGEAGDGLRVISSSGEACANALVPCRCLEHSSSSAIEATITKVLREQHEAMKEDLECFRKELLFEVRQAISQGGVHAAAEGHANDDESSTQVTDCLVYRHLAKAFRKT
ncbi:hypothetical protein CUR178_04687 [Leishmania enriettii]|uniref:Uncharacterized protein n=1 Tax=Leishmania enriettii TaxID=5663 RepID=A0A836KGH1_LEIEN|nr:hypothetical protein CUR178_04687 [Leishmania enriettii]